jgi:hypothetical protein
MKLINKIGDVSYYEDCMNGWDYILKVQGKDKAYLSKEQYKTELENRKIVENYKRISQGANERPTFVWAYPGTEKSMAAKLYKNFIDHDTFINFPTCLLLMNKALLNGKNVVAAPLWGDNDVTPFWVDESVRGQNIELDLMLCLPSTSCLSEYLERFKKRGDTAGFIETCRKDFLRNFKDIRELELKNTKRVMLRPGQFLDNALIENGVHLY